MEKWEVWVRLRRRGDGLVDDDVAVRQIWASGRNSMILREGMSVSMADEAGIQQRESVRN